MLDLTISNYFYTPGVGFLKTWWTEMIYTYGLVPGWILFFTALFALLFIPFVPRLKKFWKESLYIVLTLVIGSGLICHAGFKDHWGRPRPKQTIEFGGDAPFRPFWVIGRSEMPLNLKTAVESGQQTSSFEHSPPITTDFFKLKHRSFCCGHCTMGFYFFCLYFLGKRKGFKKISVYSLALAFILGGALSLTRIAQGGHFFTDTVASAFVMYFTAYLLARLLISKKQNIII